MKRFITVFLVFMMTFSVVGFSAEAAYLEEPIIVSPKYETKINAQDFSGTNLPEGYYTNQAYYGSNNPEISHRGAVGAYGGGYYTYTVSLKEATEFEFTIYGTFTASTSITVDVNGATQIDRIRPGEIKILEGREIGILSLEAGVSNFSVYNNFDTNHIYFYTLTPIREADKTFAKKEGSFREIKLPAMIEAENYDLGQNGFVSIDGVNSTGLYRKDGIDIERGGSGGYNIFLNRGESTTYSFDVENDGVYSFYVATKWGKLIDIYFDGMENPLKTELNLNDGYKENHIENIYLTRGTHKITLAASDETVYVDYIKAVSGSGNGVTIEALSGNPQETVIEKESKIYKNIYVAVNGSDDGDGSASSPFKTIERAKEEVKKINKDMNGDIVVNIAEGTYTLDKTLEFTNDDEGKNGYRVIYKGTNIFEPTIISGGREVTGWEKHNDKLWSAPLTGVDAVRNLYINGYPAIRAKSKYLYKFESEYSIEGSPYKVDGLKANKINFPVNLSNAEDIELVCNSEWKSDRVKVEDYFIDGDYAVFVGDRFMLNNSSCCTKGRTFYIENAPELLDEPGEFYWSREEGRIYYYPFAEENMETAEAYIGILEGMVKIAGKSIDERVKNISFEGLTFRYGAWNIVERIGGYKTTQIEHSKDQTDLDGGPTFRAQFEARRADGLTIENCEFSCLGSMAVNLEDAVSNSAIKNSLIRDISGGGIRIGTPDHYKYIEGMDICYNIEVSNNVIRRVANEFLGQVAISIFYERDINVLNNTIMDTPYTGISSGWGWENSQSYAMQGVHLQYNHIENTMKNLYDGGGIYTLGSCKESTLIGNYIRKVDVSRYGYGVYFDAGSSWMTMTDNIILDAYPWIEVQEARYATHDLKITRTYSEESYHDNNGGPNTTPDKPIYISDTGENWPEEALAIKKNAGSKNVVNLGKSELPSFMTMKIERLPVATFRGEVPKIGLKIQAEDFMEGGEGVGYHKSYDGRSSATYRRSGVALERINHNEDNLVIGTCFTGEWMNYEIDVPENGEYNMDICSWQNWSDAENFAKIYIDGELVSGDIKLAKKSELVENTVGRFNLTKGKHIIRIEFVDGFYFDWFEFYKDGKKIGNSIRADKMAGEPNPSFDDGLGNIR